MTFPLESADLVMSFDWLWSLFESVLVVSGLRIFQQACFLYSNKLLQANLPVTLTNPCKHIDN